MKVFEMAGLDRLDNKTAIAKNALRNIDGIIVVFDKSKPVSQERAEKWVEFMRSSDMGTHTFES